MLSHNHVHEGHIGYILTDRHKHWKTANTAPHCSTMLGYLLCWTTHSSYTSTQRSRQDMENVKQS